MGQTNKQQKNNEKKTVLLEMHSCDFNTNTNFGQWQWLKTFCQAYQRHTKIISELQTSVIPFFLKHSFETLVPLFGVLSAASAPPRWLMSWRRDGQITNQRRTKTRRMPPPQGYKASIYRRLRLNSRHNSFSLLSRWESLRNYGWVFSALKAAQSSYP